MSIVLRANELNTILYKYLLQSGLTHTAYSLFNEAALAQPLQEFKFDIRPAHLLSLLEKALIYAQIEAHVTLSEYVECSQPFSLLRPHTCKVAERAKKQKEQLLKELGEQINDSIKRTNSAYNAAIANRDYDDIVYEAKGNKYFQKFTKIRLPPSQFERSQQFVIKGSAETPLLHNREDFEIDLLRYDALNDEVIIQQIFPCVSLGRLEFPLDFACAGQYLVQLFRGGRLTAFKFAEDSLEPLEFLLGGDTEGAGEGVLLPNASLPQLLAIAAKEEYWVLNMSTMKLVQHGRGAFTWKEYDEFLLILPDCISLQTLSNPDPLLTVPAEHRWQEISFNSQKNLYSLYSSEEKLVHINTFQSPESLFIFDLSSENVKQTMWVSSNNVDYFCWLTDSQINVFDISLNSYSRIIDIAEYDSGVSSLSTLKKSDRDECFLLGLGNDNLLIYDVTNAKVERVEVTGKSELYPLGIEKAALVMESCIYFLVGQLIEPLFK